MATNIGKATNDDRQIEYTIPYEQSLFFRAGTIILSKYTHSIRCNPLINSSVISVHSRSFPFIPVH